MLPTAQAMGEGQKPIELRGSERTLAIHLRRTSHLSRTRRNTPGSCRPKPRSPAPWQATGAISAPSSNSPASADKAKTSRLEPTVRVLRLVALILNRKSGRAADRRTHPSAKNAEGCGTTLYFGGWPSLSPTLRVPHPFRVLCGRVGGGRDSRYSPLEAPPEASASAYIFSISVR